MGIKSFSRIALSLALTTTLSTACDKDCNYEYAPYVGYEWYAPHNNDTLCLKLLSAEDVALTLKHDERVLGRGKYCTHRLKLPFSEFRTDISGVTYILSHAKFDTRFNMIIYGDSLNADCDTDWAEWEKAFTPADTTRRTRALK